MDIHNKVHVHTIIYNVYIGKPIAHKNILRTCVLILWTALATWFFFREREERKRERAEDGSEREGERELKMVQRERERE